MAKDFRPLRSGEPIGVVALSGPVNRRRFDVGLEALRGWGHPVVTASNIEENTGYLAGDDARRLAGLVELLDGGVTTLIAARGGYGVTRLLPHLPWQRLVDEEVRFVGFSDLTALINTLVVRGGVPQIHGPMVSAGLVDPRNVRALRGVLSCRVVGRPLFRFGEAAVARPGRARGPAFGGNLAVLVALLGTPFQPDLDGSIVFLEDVAEPPYRLDRMLTQLSCSGTLQRVKALIAGSLRGCRPAKESAERWRRLIVEAAPPEAVVLTDQPFGHGAHNRAFPIGSEVEIDTDAGVVRWSG